MSRRGFLRMAAGASALVLPFTLHARTAPRIGLILPTERQHVRERQGLIGDYLDSFEAGLRQKGWEPGRNIEIRYEGSAPDAAAKAQIAALAGKVDVLVLWGNEAAQTAVREVPTLPVVAFVHFGQRAGVMESLARPGANVTGVAIEQPGIAAKRIELLRAASGVPRIVRLYYYSNKNRIGRLDEILPEYAQAAVALKVEVIPYFTAGAEGLRRALDELAGQGRFGVSTQMAPTAGERWDALQESVRRHRVPVVYDREPAVEAGGLMSYGDDWSERFRRMAHITDRVLRGAKPSEIPIEQPDTYRLAVNLDAARAIQLAFASQMLIQAERIYGRDG